MSLRFMSAAIAAPLVCLGSFVATAAHAGVILTNYPADDVTGGSLMTANFMEAKRFTMGPESMSLDSVTVRLQGKDPFSIASPAQVSAGLYATALGNKPGALLASFAAPTIAVDAASTDYMLTPAAATTLQANVSYFIRFSAIGADAGYVWNRDDGDSTYTTGNGVTFGGARWTTNGGSTWNDSGAYHLMQISASPVPEPASLSLVGAGLALIRRPRRSRRR